MFFRSVGLLFLLIVLPLRQVIAGSLINGDGECRTRKDIMRVVNSKSLRLKKLYNEFRIRNSKAQGYIRTNFYINSGGQVIECNIDSTNFTIEDFLPIFKKEILSWDFGKVEVDLCTTQITYPFNFVASNINTEYDHKHYIKIKGQNDGLKKVVKSSLQKSFLQINEIIDKRVLSWPGTNGELILFLQFNGGGKLVNYKINNSTIPDKKIEEKILIKVKRWKIKKTIEKQSSFIVIYKYAYRAKE